MFKLSRATNVLLPSINLIAITRHVRLRALTTMPFYAVAKGFKPGVYETWDQCKANTHQFNGARFKKFQTLELAQAFVDTYSGTVASVVKTNVKKPAKRALADSCESGSENVYKRFKTAELPVDKDGYVQVFTDGACENNGRTNAKAGLGVWFAPDHKLNIGEPVKGRATNNVGEIQACTKAIEIVRGQGSAKICINTDSQFVIKSMTQWIGGWKRKNWRLASGGDVKNKVDFMELDRACASMDVVKWNYVKGHAGIEGNEGADLLARRGAQLYGSVNDFVNSD